MRTLFPLVRAMGFRRKKVCSPGARLWIALLCSLPLFFHSIALASQPDTEVTTQSNPYLPIAVLVFGLSAVGLQVLVLVKRGAGWYPDATKLVGLTLILTVVLFLPTAGFGQDGLTSVVGLLGTVAGYLLGQPANQPKPAGQSS